MVRRRNSQECAIRQMMVSNSIQSGKQVQDLKLCLLPKVLMNVWAHISVLQQ